MASNTAGDLIDFSYRRTEGLSDTLERKLGMFSVVIISLSAMLGTGLFVLPALVMVDMGGGTVPVSGIWLAYMLAALAILPAAVSKGELSTAMPSSGGSYVYIERTFGPLVGTIAGAGLWGASMLKTVVALVGFKAYIWALEELIGITIDIEIAALILLALITIINILGVNKIKKIQTPIVALMVSFIAILCIWSIFTLPMNWGAAFGNGAYGAGWEDVAHATAFVFVAYAGVTKIAAVGGEIKDPSKNIPYGMILSLLIACVLYVMVTIVLVSAVDPSGYLDTDTGKAREDPVYVFAEVVGGSTAGTVSAVFAVTVLTSLALASLMATSRFPFAMARDNLLPGSLEKVHPRYQTPHLAIVGTSVSMALAITLLPVEEIAKLASGFKIMIFMTINASVIVLRRASETHTWYRPEWKSPMYPFIQIFGILSGALLLYVMGMTAVIGGLACCTVGVLIYFLYGKERVRPVLTPWRTVRTEITNPTQAEREKRWLVFHSVAGTKERYSEQMTEGEFVHAMSIISPHMDRSVVRDLFHEIDLDGNGIIDLDEFLFGIDEDNLFGDISESE